MDILMGAHRCQTVVTWRRDDSVAGSHCLVPVTCADVIDALVAALGGTGAEVVNRLSVPDSEEFAMAKELEIDADILEARSRDVYRARWVPGLPSWENASWADRDECKMIARAELTEQADAAERAVFYGPDYDAHPGQDHADCCK